MERGKIFETQDGSHSIFSEKYGVSYHSKYGAIQESRHVFINAGLLRQALQRQEIAVLEIGFGTGLNAFLSLLEADRRMLTLHYEALEAYPIQKTQAALLNYPQRLSVSDDYAQTFLDLHALEWGKEHRLRPRFTFKKIHSAFENFSSPPRFNVVFFDAFAPNAQPELWEQPILDKMYEALLPGGVFVTYCAKGVVKRRMKAAGFQIEALPGPPGKREMTRGVKQVEEVKRY